MSWCRPLCNQDDLDLAQPTWAKVAFFTPLTSLEAIPCYLYTFLLPP